MGFECYRIGDLLLDAGTQEVTRNGVAVPVPRLSFKLLLSLARHAPNVVSTEQLELEVWSGLVVDRGTVNKRVLLLRRALSDGKAGEQDPYIAVVRGSGYRLIVPVERVLPSSGEAVAEEAGEQSWWQRNAGFFRTVSYSLLGIVALLALYQGFQNADTDSITASPAGSAQALAPDAAIYSRTSIAVLPFVDLSDDGIHQYLGDGLAEEVINLLAGMEGLSVAARTSSFAFRGDASTTTEIARMLNVGSILEGSIRHSENQIRVTAQLIDCRTGYHVWSKTYDRAFDEVFEVQNEIVTDIAESLELSLDGSGPRNTGYVTTNDIEAFALYLKGRELFNDRIRLRTEGLRQAQEFFQKSIEQDPGFARAHAGIALVYWLLTSYDDSLDKERYFELAEASANFALEFDPKSADALSALASIHSARGEVEQALAMFEKVRAIGSNDSNIMHWEAMLRLRLGYFDELLEPLTEVYRLDPLNEHIGWSLAAALNFSGDPAKSASILKELEHFTYRQYGLGLSAINSGNFVLAREYLRDVRMRSGILPAKIADSVIDALEEKSLADDVARRIVSLTQNGELDAGVGYELLLILGSPRVFELGIDPHHDIPRLQAHAQIWNNWAVNVRRDPRFKEWVQTLGYVELWRKNGWPDRCKPTGPEDFECI
ncbi:MAG: winged helix-turn-helix domain-containing protein [Gammaproteobacteria bacterium]|nr:winged helix-turn-helix domain-containing protein [Gammaproteobacteria bacterium]